MAVSNIKTLKNVVKNTKYKIWYKISFGFNHFQTSRAIRRALQNELSDAEETKENNLQFSAARAKKSPRTTQSTSLVLFFHHVFAFFMIYR